MNHIELSIQIAVNEGISLAEVISDANDGIGVGDERWRMLWREPMQSEQLGAIENLVARHQPCKNVLIIGIGGSALGTKALHQALGGQSHTNVFVLDNIDPHTFIKTVDAIKANDEECADTVVVVISKSGGTTEMSALLMATQNVLPSATYIAITGESGCLRTHAIEQGWDTLLVPEGVGGRFSVLSPVGLFPIALCGINIRSLLEGATQMDDRCIELNNNPAGELAAALVSAMQDGKSVQVMMPYCDRLVQLSNWYVQLWAESLGKVNTDGVRVGPTPMTALGATDQHSMLQLWREGPTDKVIGFLEVAHEQDVELGNTPLASSQSWLCGQTLGSLLNTQRIATEQAVRNAEQGTWTLTMPEVNANSIGQFIALWQDTVAIAGRLMHLNPYNQPGVEFGKELTKNALTEE